MRALTVLLSSASFVLSLAACTDDGGAEGGETDETGETGSEADTDTETGGEECIEPPADDIEFGAQQYVRIVNTQSAPIYVKGGSCGAALFQIEVDGQVVRDNNMLAERCTNVVANDYCGGMCAAEDGTVPSLRIGAGEDILFPFDGRVWEPVSLSPSCSTSLVCPVPETCDVERRVAEGAEMKLSVEAWSTCGDAMICGCDMAETCEMASLDVWMAIGGDSTSASATFDYPQPAMVYPEITF